MSGNIGIGGILRAGRATETRWTPRFCWLICALVVPSLPSAARAQRGAPCQLSCTPNISVDADPGECSKIVNYPPPGVSGVCGTITCSPSSGSSFPLGLTTITCSAMAGPMCTFTITVNDVELPVLTCPANLSLSAEVDANCQAPVPNALALVMLTDNCPGRSVSQDPAVGEMVDGGVHPITVMAMDASGNTSQCVIDFEATGPDRDGDGLIDCADGCPDDAGKTEPGTCGCGVTDTDANSNGTADCLDPPANMEMMTCGACAQGVLPAALLSMSLMYLGRRRRS
ncbi:MAG TPA: hypothetical protein VJZ71_18135 [Phycisphaerae bacterium]|nr:hypothetical protein [Phycisphaerae bacterium]